MQKKKILIVKSGAIGDVLMATPLIREIAKKEPTAEIDFLIESWSSPILKYHPILRKLIILPDNTFKNQKISILLFTLIKLFLTRYHQIYLLHPHQKFIYFFKLLKRPLACFEENKQIFFPKKIHHSHLYLSLYPPQNNPSANLFFFGEIKNYL